MKKGIVCLCFVLTGCSNAVLGPLYNQSEEDVKSAWGQPSAVTIQNNRQMWAYKQGECTKFVFFNEKGIAKEGQETGVCLKSE